jgi:hypothetical protein
METEFIPRKQRTSCYTSTLDDGYWTPGMVIEKDDGTQWVVRGNEDVPWDAPAEAFEAQRLERL